MSEMTASVETIDVKTAQAMLLHVQPNRRLLQRRVAYLENQIANGDYRVNGESIIIDRDGRVVDGSHRLHAIIAAQCPIQSVVVRGVDPASFATIDSGLSRQNCDRLEMAGLSTGWAPRRLTAILAALAWNGHAAGQISAVQMFDMRRRYSVGLDALSPAAAEIRFGGKRSFIAASYAAGVAAVCYDVSNVSKVEAFYESMTTGVIDDPRGSGSAILSARNFLTNGSLAKRGEAYLKIQRCVQAYLAGERITKLNAPAAPIWDVSIGSDWWLSRDVL